MNQEADAVNNRWSGSHLVNISNYFFTLNIHKALFFEKVKFCYYSKLIKKKVFFF